jgi:hypothetical protein
MSRPVISRQKTMLKSTLPRATLRKKITQLPIKMDEKNLIDDCFYIEKARWDVYHSYDKEQKRIITSLTEEGCINATRYYMKGLQEGFMEVITHQGSVDGKL